MKFSSSVNLLTVSKIANILKHYFFRWRVKTDRHDSCQQMTKIAEEEQECLGEKDFSDLYVKLNCNKPTVISDNDTNCELSEADNSKGYNGESSSVDEK